MANNRPREGDADDAPVAGGGESGDGIDGDETDDARVVQDNVEAGVGISGSCRNPDGTPAKLRTLLVRRPGRVSAAIQFVERCLTVVGFGACGSGDELNRDMDGQRTISSGAPTPEFMRARAAALKTMEAYFSGHIDDDLLIEADFKIDGQVTTLRCAGPLDGQTGRMRDARYTPSPPAAPKVSPQPVDKTRGGHLLKLPADIDPRSVLAVEDGPRPGVLLLTFLRPGGVRDVRLIDSNTGDTVR